MTGRDGGHLRYYDSGDYERTYRALGYFDRSDEEVAFLLSQTSDVRRVLDVGCGTGRHALHFARRGIETLGLDRSPRSVVIARRICRGLPARFLVQDARVMQSVEGDFDLVTCLFSSFGSHDEEGNAAILKKMATHLRPDGLLSLDLDHEAWLVRSLAQTGGHSRLGRFEEWLSYDPRTHTIFWRERHGRRCYRGRTRLYGREELLDQFTDLGLHNVRFFGGFDGQALSDDSPRLLALASRT